MDDKGSHVAGPMAGTMVRILVEEIRAAGLAPVVLRSAHGL